MPRKYGKANYRHEDDRYDQLPKWVTRSGAMRMLAHPDTRLYLTCISLADKYTRNVTYENQKQLCQESRIYPGNLKRSLESLVLSGMLAVKDIKARHPEIQIIFNNPDKTTEKAYAKTTTRSKTTSLNAEVASKRSLSSEEVIPRITKSYPQDNLALSA